MSQIWLVRHASTAWTGVRWAGRSDPPLTEAGLADARTLADAIADAVGGPVAVVASPSRRAADTAGEIGRRLRVPVSLDADLREVDLGRVDGLVFDEVGTTFPDLAAALAAGRRDIDWPEGETASDFRARAARAWDRLVARAADAEVIAVTHGGVIGELLRIALSPDAVPAGPAAPASAIRLAGDRSGWQVDTLAPALRGPG